MYLLTHTHTHTHTCKFWILIPCFERPHYNIYVIWSFEAIFLTTCQSAGCIQIRRNLSSHSQEGKLVDRQSVPQTGRPRELVHRECSPCEYKWRAEVTPYPRCSTGNSCSKYNTHACRVSACFCSPMHKIPEFVTLRWDSQVCQGCENYQRDVRPCRRRSRFLVPSLGGPMSRASSCEG
jgi:hypothetical protein